MGIVGHHVYGDLYGVEPRILSDKDFLVRIIREAAERANAKILEIKTWELGGDKGGVSIIALIVESHIALHTWPNYRYATLDVYTCGEDADPWAAFKYIVEALKPKTYTVHYTDRTQLPIGLNEK